MLTVNLKLQNTHKIGAHADDRKHKENNSYVHRTRTLLILTNIFQRT